MKKKPPEYIRALGRFLVEVMGLEPMTFRVWGERSSQLSYTSVHENIIAR